MSLKKMKIHIDRGGRTAIQVEGGQGDNCLAFTQAIEQALGKIEQRDFTADYHTDVIAVKNYEALQECQEPLNPSGLRCL